MNKRVFYVAAFLFSVWVIVSGVYTYSYLYKPQQLASPTVKMQLLSSHGSGVHIGGGFILTAAHVATGPITVVASDGRLYQSKTLWIAEGDDIALVKIYDEAEIASAALNCSGVEIGDEVVIEGFPLKIGSVTTRGVIAGDKVGKYVIQGDILPGMSGGPVFDANGDIVGINHAVFQVGASPTGYGKVIKSSAVCDLLARG